MNNVSMDEPPSPPCGGSERPSQRPALWRRRFAELQYKIVGLANGCVFGSVLIAEREGRWERPDALQPVRRVLRIGVDLGGADKYETSRLCERNGVVLPDIAILRFRILRPIALAAMLLDAKHSARLQRPIECREGFVRETLLHPIVQIAKRQNEIRRTRGCDFG